MNIFKSLSPVFLIVSGNGLNEIINPGQHLDIIFGGANTYLKDCYKNSY